MQNSVAFRGRGTNGRNGCRLSDILVVRGGAGSWWFTSMDTTPSIDTITARHHLLNPIGLENGRPVQSSARTNRSLSTGVLALSLGVLHKGNTIHTMHCSKPHFPDGDSIYCVGSMLKILTVCTIGRLRHDGILGWDVPI